MKGIFVIMDGVADEECEVLKGKTPLEYAKTPNLDYFAERGRLEYCYSVKEGFVPESNEGVLSLFGYDAFSVGRGALEALGIGIKLRNGDLAFRCNFATLDDLDNRKIIDRRVGRILTTKEARRLAKAINKGVKLSFPFEFYSSIQHRGVLVIRGGFSDNISDVRERNGKLVLSESLDDEDDSELSSEIVNQFVRKSFEVLDRHSVNIVRRKRGFYPANVILCRGAESDKVRLKKMKGKWMALGYMPLEKGIARAVGMNVYGFRYPKLRDIDVYDNLYRGLKRAIKYSIKMLKRNRKRYDYFYIHFKETDIPGHDNKPFDKVKMIELLDKRFFYFLRRFVRDARIVVTADHTTSCKRRAHSDAPVPVLSYAFNERIREGQRFTEAWGMKGKRAIAGKLLKEKLFGR